MSEKKQILPSEIASALGSIRTPKKEAAFTANFAKSPKRTQRPLIEITCTCGKCPDVYEVGIKAGDANCPRAKTIRQRNWRAAKAAALLAQPEGES